MTWDISQESPLQRSEAFMKDYYDHTRNIFQITERITQQFATGESSGRLRALFNFLPVPKTNEEHFEGFFSRHGTALRRGARRFHQGT